MPLPEKRRDQLLELLKRGKFHSIDELKLETGVPHATLHRDLNALESEGLIRKTYGGVEVLLDKAPVREYDKRIEMNVEAKLAIAEAALSYVKPGDHIFVDASSTCYHFAKAVLASGMPGVTIVSNSVHLLEDYRSCSGGVKLVSTGGSLDKELNAFLGEFTTEFISRIRVSKIFVSAAGCSLENGISTSSDFILGAVKAAIASAKERYCLLDSGKFGREYLFKLAKLDEFDAVVTDSGVSKDCAAKFKSAGMKLVVAKAQGSKQGRGV